MQVQPNTSFETVNQFATGLAGTVGVRIIDNAGATTTARVTTGITEYPAGSGIYQKTLTSPSTAGQYTIVWDDTTTFKIVELVVTATTLGALTGELYVTRDEVKAALSMDGQTFADDDIDRAINAASRGIDEATGRFFFSSSDTRYYTPERNAEAIQIDDLTTLTSLEVDIGGSGTYTTWTVDSDFWLEPVNDINQSKPYTQVRLRTQKQYVWPCWRRSVKITGTFGWAEVPAQVRQFALFLSQKLLYRARHAPLGIVMVASDTGAVAHLARTDPDFQTLLGPLVKTRPFV